MFFLFDFDGTLVNSFNAIVEKSNLLADEFNFRKIADHEKEGLRNLSSKELMQFLGVPFYNIPKLIPLMRKHLTQAMPELAPVGNMPFIIEQLHQAGISLGILTSNSVENVKIWLDIHNMRHFFKFIHAEPQYFTKRYLIKKTLKKYRIDKSRAFYIGDETRDIDAASKNNIRSIAVTWGYNSEKALLQYQPSYLVNFPEELLAINCLSETTDQ